MYYWTLCMNIMNRHRINRVTLYYFYYYER
jgi:hypothetical protein